MLFKSSSAAAQQPPNHRLLLPLTPFFWNRSLRLCGTAKRTSKRGAKRNVQEPPGERGAAGRWPAPRGAAAAEGGRELRGRPQASRINRDHRAHGRQRPAKNHRRPGRAELPEHAQLALCEGIFTQNATNASKWHMHAPLRCVRACPFVHGALLFYFFLHGSEGLFAPSPTPLSFHFFHL